MNRRYRGKGPFYEIWFGRIGLGEGRALWFRYSLLDGVSREAATWAIFFDRGGDEISIGKNSTSLESLDWEGSQAFSRDQDLIDSVRGRGTAGDIEWRFEYENSGLRFRHVPFLVRTLGIAKSELNSFALDAMFDGAVRVGGREIEFQAAPGMIGHIHGTRQALEWAWAHCNTFEGPAADGLVFEGLSARIPLLGRPSPPVSSFVLFREGRRIAFSSTLGMMRPKSEWKEGLWTFRAKSWRWILEGEANANPEKAALVEYEDTDGSKLWCRNSKLSNLKIRLFDRLLGKTYEYRASGSAAFETVSRNPK
ncbi:MAG: hypothetical protein IT285_01645 [Bdellovibrionales bacterium]|nr:hypothetical protein [Bdellovibrionales bacterium]